MAANGSAAAQRRRGFVLVLVVDEKQAVSEHEAIVRVCHDYDVAGLPDLELVIADAAEGARNQLRLRAAMGRLLARVASA